MKQVLLLLLFLLGLTANAQKVEVSGRVLGSRNETIPGATVLEQGTNNGSAANSEGVFTLSVDSAATLIFSAIGFQAQRVPLNKRTTIEVVLQVSAQDLNEVVVVGSRGLPLTNVARPVPVDVLTSREIVRTGQTDLGQMLHFTAPSFNSTKHAISNVTTYVDPATLRGLGPDQTLVLVNGKRRHQSAALNVNNVVGRGSVGTDLNAIPTAAIERVEILRDGAAAQYGSDAIAGIVNIVLKKNPHGGTVTGNYGITEKRDGATYDTGINVGLPVGKSDGFLNLTLQGHHNDPTDRSGNFTGRVYNANVRKDDSLVALQRFDRDVTTYGLAKNTMGQFFYNGETGLGGPWRVYSFGGYSYKDITAYGFFRNPSNRARAVLPLFPNGYNPKFPAKVQDAAATVGVRRATNGGWNMDFSVGGGQNIIDAYANTTVNPSYGSASPTSFYSGRYRFGQGLADVNLSKSFTNIGGLKSLNMAYGAELRAERYELVAGDDASWKKGPVTLNNPDVGSSGREGIGQGNAVVRTRSNVGVYADVESDLTRNLLVGVAGRFENYSDFGANVSGKLSARYKILDRFSVRGSINRGFRAPSMHQLYYSSNADAQWLTINGVFDSYPVAHLRNDNPYLAALGVSKLKAETTLDYNFGLTAQITPKLTFTADAYQIDITDRVVISGQIDAKSAALAPIFNGSGYAQVQFFSNALDTRTRGVDVVGSYRKQSKDQELNFSLALALNQTKLRGEVRSPDKLAKLGTPLVDRVMIGLIEVAQPRSKFIGSASYRYKKLEGLVRATRFGEVTAVQTTSDLDQTFRAKIITDASLTFGFTPSIGLTLGANNLFNIYPDQIEFPSLTATGQTPYTRFTSQFGFMGAYYFTALRFSF